MQSVGQIAQYVCLHYHQTVAQGVPCQYCCHPAGGAPPPKHCESALSQHPELQSSLQ